jgi:hypothetical protein
MPTFVFTYQMPTDYGPGRPETMAAWTAWFESMGESLADIAKRSPALHAGGGVEVGMVTELNVDVASNSEG